MASQCNPLPETQTTESCTPAQTSGGEVVWADGVPTRADLAEVRARAAELAQRLLACLA